MYLQSLRKKTLACCRKDGHQLLKRQKWLTKFKLKVEVTKAFHIRQIWCIMVRVIPEQEQKINY